MLLTIVVFSFGIVACGIVTLGVLNARDLAAQIAVHKAAVIRQQED